MTAPWRPPGSYIFGTGADTHVVVPARVARILVERAGLKDFHHRHRGVDGELDSLLVALRTAGVYWATSATGSGVACAPEVAASSEQVNTSEAADLLGITDRAVRLAIREKRIRAQQVGGRWVIDREEIEHWRARRAA